MLYKVYVAVLLLKIAVKHSLLCVYWFYEENKNK